MNVLQFPDTDCRLLPLDCTLREMIETLSQQQKAIAAPMVHRLLTSIISVLACGDGLAIVQQYQEEASRTGVSAKDLIRKALGKHLETGASYEQTMLDNLYFWTDQEGISRERALEAATIYFVNHGFDEFLVNRNDPRFRPETEDEEMNSFAMSAEMLRKDPNLFEEIEGWNTLDDETKEEVKAATWAMVASAPRVQ